MDSDAQSMFFGSLSRDIPSDWRVGGLSVSVLVKIFAGECRLHFNERLLFMFSSRELL